MMIGGDRFAGIHGVHLGRGVHIRYAASDSTRQSISWVDYRNETTGESRRFNASDPPGNPPQAPAEYEMQCVDCHNRPTHAFDLPERAMDKALTAGDISPALPFIKKVGVEALKAGYGSSEEAARKIPAAVTQFYQGTYPAVYTGSRSAVDAAAGAVLRIYNRNVFPDLKVTWGTYPNNIGHTDFPGCFRCHDGGHTAQDGKTIGQDCNLCHEPLAIDEASPEILKTLGLQRRLWPEEK
jgi:hypothetical protein